VGNSRILIVSHERTIVEYVSALLQGSGYDTEIETSTTEAIRNASRSKPHLLIIDPVMPGLTGWDTAARISRQTKCGVLFLTTAAFDSKFRDTLQDLRKEGCKCQLLSVPFEEANLLRKLRLLVIASNRRSQNKKRLPYERNRIP
jgi:CheY-like chemotaxis protein